MKALRLNAYGDALKVEDIDVPTITATQVLVRVQKASFNPLDVKLASGKMSSIFPLALPYSVGTDFAGVVEDAGVLATAWKKGDRVFGRGLPALGGAFGELLAIDARFLASVPSGLSMKLAAALPTIGGTAWQALFEVADVGSGLKVLIHGASRGVGSIALQLAKLAGARTTATASQDNIASVHAMGADAVLDYRTMDLAELSGKFDVVLDTVGGDLGDASIQTVKPGGIIVSIVAPPNAEKAAVAGVRHTRVTHVSDGARLRLIANLAADNKIVPVVDPRVFTLGDAVRGFDAVRENTAHGKIVVTVQ